MNESLKIDRTVDQLGLPPMELAESSTNGRTISNSIYNCLYVTLQKVFLLLLLLTFSAGTYILLLKLIENTDTSRNTDIILLTETKGTANFTLHREDMNIFFQIYNTTNSSSKRSKRSTLHFQNNFMNQFNDDDAEKVKEIILNHRRLCRNQQQHDVCNKLITKLKAIIDNNIVEAEIPENLIVGEKPKEKNEESFIVLPSDVKKREAHPISKLRGVIRSPSELPFDSHPANLLPHNHGQHQSMDTCLLAKLLRQNNNYPHVHAGVYDSPVPETPHLDHRIAPDMRFVQQPMSSYLQNREAEGHGHRHLPIVHPQDLEIFMAFLTTPTPDNDDDHVKSNATTRNVQCSFGTRSCGNGMDCIEEKLWCDGQADCPNSNDEISCSCKSRVDSSRLCDGYFDCPMGEDEMGCFGCSENTFSCEDLGINPQSTCFSKEQRCNNIVECPNQKDEIDCNMLAPSLLEKPMFSISSTEGFLHRNFRGDWFPVCQNPYMYAHDACRRETGLIIRPPLIQVVPIDPMFKISYLNTAPGGVVQQSDTCFNNSAIYVTCPDFLCGTRVVSTSQLVKENAEMSLFGRNKRFLFPKHSFNPYRLMNYGNRMKRDTSAVKIIDDIESTAFENLLEDNTQNIATSRVVGGKPSQPAAWPWMVAMYRDGMFHCGGVILTQNWVISAAHCVHKFWDHYYEIQVGMLRRFSFSPQEQIHKVTHIIVNQHYRQADMKNDLSLLKVEPGIQFSRWVRPICLPSVNTAGPDWLWGPAPGTICTAVGWGATAEHGPDPDHMREVEVPIWDKCKHREDVAGKEICAGFMKGGKDACQGDSGGPLLCKNPMNEQQWYLVGIVSHGDGCGRQDEPGVYTRVSLFTKWIKYHTTTQSLPLLQPIQECPGFKCKFGILKCLPHNRKCDRIVDCLNAEDEMNCIYNNTIDQQEKSSEIGLRGTKTKDSVTNEPITASVIKREHNSVTTQNPIADSTENPSTTHRWTPVDPTEKLASSQERRTDDSDNPFTTHIQFPVKTTENPTTTHRLEVARSEANALATHIEPNPSTTNKWNFDDSTTHKNKFSKEADEMIDFSKASTLEMSISKSTEDQSSSDESVTSDPILDSKKTDIATSNPISDDLSNENNRGDLQTIAITFNPNELESRAIIKKSGDNNEVVPIPIMENATVESNQDLDNSFASSTNDQISESTDQAENVIINLPIPNIQRNETDEHPVNEKNDDLTTVITDTVFVTTTEIIAKNLPEAESKSDLNNKLEEFVISDLQPANRKKHQTPQEFECRRIPQVISFNQRCDHTVDCEDGTDELECNCLDYLSSFNENLICDGIFDCAGGEDEINCYSCPEQHFLCKRSEICLPLKYVCDGKAQCPTGEDEFNCFALTNGREIFYDVDEKPKINLEGYLTERNKDNWQVICENDLTAEQQEQSAVHICHYLGFSTANKYSIKYVNVRDEDIIRPNTFDKRKRRNTGVGSPLQFAYREPQESNITSRQIFINNPQILKEECLSNVTKTCKSLYVSCDRSLYTDFVFSEQQLRSAESLQNNSTQMWPWIAKILMEGDYKCTGILVELSWVLISDSCLWDASSTYTFITVVLGSQRTINSVTGYYEKVHKVDSRKYLYRSRAVLLHLENPVEYSNMVKPMILSSSYFHPDNNTFCVTVGQDNSNNTVNVFLEETTKKCNPSNRCFIRRNHQKLCQPGKTSDRHWAGLISCHNNQGWFPTASFVDSTGECGLGDTINATDIENLRYDIKHYSQQLVNSKPESLEDICDGIRCGRGVCLPFKNVCDGVKHCEDGNDENKKSCEMKHIICKENPYHRGCECASGEMKCKNGKCVSKELFGDGHDDCGDGSDEPRRSSLCSDYLARVMPSRLCDGILHCQDRSDEDPMYCKCFSKRSVPCNPNSNEENYCVAPDMICDGVPDCPHGEDEATCMGLSAPKGTKYGTGQVLIQSHGVWHSKCYPTLNHTKFELEKICRELGFISGHAKEIKNVEQSVLHNSIALDSFVEVPLNNQTSIKIRNTKQPLAKAVIDQENEPCHPVVIECL